mmetsp:Transcript_31333/g.71664  ORF Transcript_31333/g.71664 Transcript_31333/m.71664 type:complete len:91 (+) Transcript_31333:482-754(+)
MYLELERTLASNLEKNLWFYSIQYYDLTKNILDQPIQYFQLTLLSLQAFVNSNGFVYVPILLLQLGMQPYNKKSLLLCLYALFAFQPQMI